MLQKFGISQNQLQSKLSYQIIFFQIPLETKIKKTLLLSETNFLFREKFDIYGII